MRHLTDAWHTIVPRRDDPHGPLPGLLVALTVVTGLVDAFSYLALGRVFVANMTGNVVFLAFDLGGASGFVWWASLLAIVTFLGGAYAGGLVGKRHGGHRARHLLVAAAVQGLLVLVSFALAIVLGAPYSGGALAVLVILLGLAMGLQNATARSLAVPDLTTTVLTLTLVGISADEAQKGQSRLGRRLVSVLAMFAGGAVGAVLVVGGHGSWALLIAALLLGTVAYGAGRLRHADDEWTRPG